MFSPMGGKGKKNSSRKYNKRGGCGSCVLSPAPFDGVGALAVGGEANFANVPTMPPKSTMVGGGIGYGYTSGADAGKFGGNYFPITKECMAGGVDPSRGGNNFMSGGKRRSRGKRSGGKRSAKRKSGGKSKSRTKRSSTKRRGGKKWSQKGCMRGGLMLVV